MQAFVDYTLEEHLTGCGAHKTKEQSDKNTARNDSKHFAILSNASLTHKGD
ncbi:hypothetical protein SBDP1_250019 [Syntrophobacter sp. SbD1]|nr:hypothetical protein SBDP1_250019 [Syntrophobacter sp. SbD1]